MATARLDTVITADSRGFAQGVDKAQQRTAMFESQLNGMRSMVAGAFSIGAVVAFSRTLLKTADDMQTAANTFGLTMDSVIGLKTAMAGSSIGAERMLQIFNKVNEAQAGVVKGELIMTDALKALNISQEEFVGAGVDQALAMMADGLMNAQNETAALNAISEMFGARIGPDMVEVLNRINDEGLAKFQEEGKKSAAAMDELATASDWLEKAWNGLLLKGAQLVSALVKIGQVALESIKFAAAAVYTTVDEAAAWAGRMSVGDNSQGLGESVAKGLEQDYDTAIQNVSDKWVEAEENIDAKRKEIEERAQMRRESAIEALTKRQEADAEKLAKKQEALDKKRESLQGKQVKLSEETEEKRKDILAGKGVSTPEMANVDALQRVGGIVGGVAGMKSQEARILEREIKIQEAMKSLQEEHNRKLDEINQSLKDLGGD